MAADKAFRQWCAVAQYPGLRDFMVGTAQARHDAPMHEVEIAIRSVADSFLPPGYAIKNMVPGAIWFVPGGDE